MSDLRGRCFVVTGANAGIGRATAEALARRGGRVILCGRSEARTLPVVEAIKTEVADAEVRFVQLDLASLASVAAAAKRLAEEEPRIDVLINNAGLAGHRGVTEDGFEVQFGVNHLGHHLFTRLLLPTLLANTPCRVVVVSSRNHERAKGIDFDAVQKTTATRVGLHEYDVSKLANVLFAKELARRYGPDGLFACSLNPGQVASDVWRRIPWPLRPLFIAIMGMKTNEEGARTSAYCATTDDDLENGGYYQDEKRTKEQPRAHDEALARELWERSEVWVADWL
jgi:retinol dehydrogenase 12